MSNRVSFELSASNTFLSDLFEGVLDDAVSSEPLEVNSVEIILKRIGEANLRPEGKSIHIFLPLNIQLRRPAGLFTVEGSGSINLHLVVDYDIDSNLQLKAKSDLITHEWLEKPVLEIGALNIPVETLVNMVIKHHESIITAKIDASLKEVSDLHTFLVKGVEKAHESINNQDLKGSHFELQLSGVSLVEPIINNGVVQLNGFLAPKIEINTNTALRTDKVAFDWIDNQVLKQDSSMRVDIEMPYDLLKNEMKEALQGMEVGGKYFDVRSIAITGGEWLCIDLVIDDPIKAQVFVKGKPVYNEIEGVLFVSNLNVDVNPANFIYKLTAPLVNRFIENKMEEFFPLEVNQKLGEVVKSKIPSEVSIPNGMVNIHHKSVHIESLAFTQERIIGQARIDNLKVEINRN